MAAPIDTDDLTHDLRALVAEMEALLQEGGAKLKERLGDAGASLESDLAQAINKHKPGDKLDLKVQRGSQTMSVTVTLGQLPS